MSNPSQTKSTQLANINRSNEVGKPPMLNVREQRIKRAEQQNLETIQYAVSQVNKLAGEDKPTIPEAIFVKYFLPFFAQEKGNYPPTAYEEWLKISKNGILPVVVIGDNGEEVVTVPPRYYRSLINVRTKRDRVAISDAMATFTDLAVSSPIRAKNYFNNVIQPNTGNNDSRQEAINQYNEAMDKVLIHYGKKTGLSNSKSNSTVSSNDEKPKTVYTEEDLL